MQSSTQRWPPPPRYTEGAEGLMWDREMWPRNYRRVSEAVAGGQAEKAKTSWMRQLISLSWLDKETWAIAPRVSNTALMPLFTYNGVIHNLLGMREPEDVPCTQIYWDLSNFNAQEKGAFNFTLLPLVIQGSSWLQCVTLCVQRANMDEQVQVGYALRDFDICAWHKNVFSAGVRFSTVRTGIQRKKCGPNAAEEWAWFSLN